MGRFRSTRARRWAACLAILGLLFQAGLAVWHGTAMFAHAAGQDGGAQAGLMCHGDRWDHATSEPAAGTDEHGGKAFVQNCPCCLGLVAAATAQEGTSGITLVLSATIPIIAALVGTTGRRHPLAPESRGPPNLV